MKVLGEKRVGCGGREKEKGGVYRCGLPPPRLDVHVELRHRVKDRTTYLTLWYGATGGGARLTKRGEDRHEDVGQ